MLHKVFSVKTKIYYNKVKLDKCRNTPENSYLLPRRWFLKYSSSYSIFQNFSCPDNDFSLHVCLAKIDITNFSGGRGLKIILCSVLFNPDGFVIAMIPIQINTLK